MRPEFIDAADPALQIARSAWLKAVHETEARRLDERQEARKKKEAEARESLDDLIDIVAAVSVSPARIAALTTRIGDHQHALIEAPIDNQQALDLAELRLQETLDRAYVLDDGRRVFKTEDGAHVFDEHGTELGHDEIDPDAIEDHRPRWEQAQAELEERRALQAHRDELLAYQQKLDAAEDRIAGGELTAAEIDELDTLLENDVPDSVRARLPGAAMQMPEIVTAGPAEQSDARDLDSIEPLL